MNRNFVMGCAICLCLFASCRTPKNLALPSTIEQQVKGMGIIVNFKNNTQVEGELIAVDEKEIIVLRVADQTASITRLPIEEVLTVVVKIAATSEEAKAISLWATFNPFITIAHGAYMGVTVPANLLVSIISANNAASARYIIRFPIDGSYKELHKFARFPQGLPEGIDIEMIK